MSREEGKEQEIRSDEVQEILSQVPNWMIRWGITLIFILLISLLCFSWFIKYPQVIPASVELTTSPPPAKLVAKTSGYLRNVNYVNDSAVTRGQAIAQIANPVRQESIDSLKVFIAQLEAGQYDASAEKIGQLVDLGSAQAEVSTLYGLLIEYNRLMSDPFFENTIETLSKQVNYNSKLAILSREQLALFQKEFKSANEKFRSDSVLFENGVIAKHTFFLNQSEFFAKQQTLLDVEKSNIQHALAAAEYKEQKNVLLQNRYENQRRIENGIAASLKSLQAFVNDWQENYVIIAPISGRLAYLSNLAANDFVKIEQPLFAIIPANENVFGLATITSQGYGKVRRGQKVRISLDNFPEQEYGSLMGRVSSISRIANEGGYMVKIEVNQAFLTSYNKNVTYQPGMIGQAEIITEDIRLLERVFYSIRRIFER